MSFTTTKKRKTPIKHKYENSIQFHLIIEFSLKFTGFWLDIQRRIRKMKKKHRRLHGYRYI